MASHYSIVRYVPDPIADERINIGVIVVCEDDVHIRFLENWHRVSNFGSGSVRFARDFAHTIQERHRIAPHRELWSLEELRRLSVDWANSIQFSEPRASLKTGDALFDEVVSKYLRDEPLPIQAYRDRQDAMTTVVRKTKVALRRRFGLQGTRLVKKRYQLQGALYSHTFDVVAANGKPFFAAQALSVELPDPRRVEKDIDAAGWSLRDLRSRFPSFPAAIVALMPPSPTVDAAQQENIDRLTRLSDFVEVELVPELGLDDWSARMAALVPYATDELP